MDHRADDDAHRDRQRDRDLPNQTLTLARVPVELAGVAGSMLQLGQRVGSAMGIALVLSTYYSLKAGGSTGRSRPAPPCSSRWCWSRSRSWSRSSTCGRATRRPPREALCPRVSEGPRPAGCPTAVGGSRCRVRRTPAVRVRSVCVPPSMLRRPRRIGTRR
ncbi:hypothetical protein NKG05_25055 [Oerskovia sp. M15]